MRQIDLTPREARMLRGTLANSTEGYDNLDLLKFDWMAKKLAVLAGDFNIKMDELGREEKRIRRAQLRGQVTKVIDGKAIVLTKEAAREATEEALMGVRYDMEDLQEEADKESAKPWFLEEADYKLVKDKLTGVKWLATDEARPVVIGILKALEDPPQVEPSAATASLEPEAKAEPNTHKRKVSLVEA